MHFGWGRVPNSQVGVCVCVFSPERLKRALYISEKLREEDEGLP